MLIELLVANHGTFHRIIINTRRSPSTTAARIGDQPSKPCATRKTFGSAILSPYCNPPKRHRLSTDYSAIFKLYATEQSVYPLYALFQLESGLAYAKWPKFTGRNCYPVPHKEDDPHLAYEWRQKYVGQYGADRVELLEHMIAHFEGLAKITLENLQDATEQQVFDQVATHLLTQNEKSEEGGDDFGQGRCVYLSSGGLMCAAGCLIGDDHTARAFDTNPRGSSWRALLDSGLVPKSHSDLIAALQEVHDSASPCNWRAALESVATKFGLEFNF